ncbi:MAG: protein-S-isoprenylcysteine O-methyltransferase Ste14 [Halieaceae bacterium]|jgi:protein-S-isoprenylcysteine O-methyltransferase Ste14
MFMMQLLELRVPPIIQLLAMALLMWSVSRYLPAFALPIGGAVWLATAYFIAGTVLAILGVREFRKARTSVDPRTPAKAGKLVSAGVYRISRNPMYLGMLLVLIGWAFYLRSSLALALLPVFVVYMSYFQIKPEERFMREKFTGAYDAYCSAVGRWL